jgi:hypothetical protein
VCPFPALLYCFSTIDLLGSLYEGDATGNTRRYGQQVGTTIKARKYMVDLIGYPEFETNLLQDQFRHKLVHLAQPQYSNRSIGWQLDNLYLGDHMILKKLESRQEILTLTPITLEGDHVFIISIEKLVYDIEKSVRDTDTGYLARLRRNQDNLQLKFDKAVQQKYGHT